MLRIAIAAAVALLPLAAHAQSEQQALVDRATLTVQEMLGVPNLNDPAGALRRARAVMICPRIFRAGFIIGGSGGDCVLVARDGAGSWSSPAFYNIGSGSIGVQAGIQDNEVIMMIMNDRALSAVMDSSFKIGGNASITLATAGAGIEGDTTAALNADIVAFSKSRGLFVGIALDGSLLSSDTRANMDYYGQPLAARQIVIQMQANNPAADPLRAMLSRFGGPAPAMAQTGYPQYYRAGAPPRGYASQQRAPTYPPAGPDRRGPVQQEALPPPR